MVRGGRQSKPEIGEVTRGAEGRRSQREPSRGGAPDGRQQRILGSDRLFVIPPSIYHDTRIGGRQSPRRFQKQVKVVSPSRDVVDAGVGEVTLQRIMGNNS